MLHRGLAAVAAVIVFPAHALLVRYDFASQVDILSPELAVALNLQMGGTLTGTFLFDDEAERIAYSECATCNHDGSVTYPGIQTKSTYDASSMVLSTTINGRELTATGTTLLIQDTPLYALGADIWRLDTNLVATDVGSGYVVSSMRFVLNEVILGPLTSSELQIADPTQWPDSASLTNRFNIGFTNGEILGSRLTSITAAVATASVPEPATLTLLGAGLLGMFFGATKNRRAAGFSK